jgi:hypothetical protein
MQLVSRNGTRQDKYNSGTYDSITINCLLKAAALNTAIASNAFDPSQVSVKVVLKRKGKTYVIMQDNLLILGLFNHLEKNLHEFVNGIDKVYPAADAKALKIRIARLNFGGHTRVGEGDELIAEVTVGSAVYSSAIDATESSFEFYLNPSIGYETGVYSTVSEVVQSNAPKQSFNPGDNITKLIYLNFDKQTLDTEVLSNVNIQSDRLDVSLTFNQLLGHHLSQYGEIPMARYATSLPLSGGNAVYRALDYYPQSAILFDGDKIANELDNLKVEMSFNSANVSASQNFLVWRRYETWPEIIIAAKERENKHINEKIEKINQA